MRLKVHNNGRVVIPAEIRHQLDIAVGDHLEVEIDHKRGLILLRKPTTTVSYRVGGPLAAHAEDRPFPSEADAADALRRGLTGGA